ncbi:hypothetical protein [Mycolicibacterium helvum]|uniref:Uncharacterized protein n=1 Tax=Mycolicibacterium helvum TaxID=1534349 RepID=A0A7I7TDP4_9MYCO|nr:hypothetical protein [Mycolicibacterium helvum]BBY67228.1 hypothetical protein MHEL_54710 [Mycolicibacterium helvum]
MMSNEPHVHQDSLARRRNYATPTAGRSSRLKAFGTIVGAGAVLAAVFLTLAQPDTSVAGPGHVVAGGNNNPTYAPPAVPGMNMGGTVTETTPSSALPVEKAVPQIKAGH